jgi:ABC-type branched-subunit amino acid transport system ATPase component
VLSAIDVSVRFGALAAVDGVGLEAGADEILGIIGPNGSGKSTLLNALTGVVPAAGRATMDGQPVPFGRPERIRALGLMRMFQAPQTFAQLACLENVALASPDLARLGVTGAWLRRRSMMRRERERFAHGAAALERVGLGGFADALAGSLTYGQQRLLELARCIAGRPRVLMLDEPSAGLNAVETDHLARLLVSLRADGLGLIVVDHKIDFINEVCDRLMVLELGRAIAEGPPHEVWREPRVMDAYLGVAGDA